MNIMHNKMENL